MSEHRTIEERYGSDIEASDLTLLAGRGCQLDTIVAAGMVAVSNPLAMELWRWVYGQDANARHAVLDGLVKWMKAQSRQQRWDKTKSMVEVTVAVADWYRDRVCRTCNGVRYELVQGTPMLSDVPCQACHGTGESSLDKLLIQFGGKWISRGKDLRAHMDNLSSMACSAMLKKMRNAIEDGGL